MNESPTVTCNECGADYPGHRLGCAVLKAAVASLGLPPGANALVDGEPARIVVAGQPTLIEVPPPLSLAERISRLRNAVYDYYAAKAAHRKTTEELTDAKKAMDECARGVLETDDRERQPGLPLA
jgi:hypothetical protein